MPWEWSSRPLSIIDNPPAFTYYNGLKPLTANLAGQFWWGILSSLLFLTIMFLGVLKSQISDPVVTDPATLMSTCLVLNSLSPPRTRLHSENARLPSIQTRSLRIHSFFSRSSYGNQHRLCRNQQLEVFPIAGLLEKSRIIINGTTSEP
ncbi:hypothetical protein L218DRAFT_254430 [Marasmius fiardii PR-910]|nr:hypothetical protein L218DRAFT_254430 [Marasmius fiardii PR-910]